MNFQMFKLVLEKAEEPEIKLPTFPGSSKKQELQRIARRDKKAFFHEQCKEIEENNRMGKTRDLLKKIRDTKETFLAKIGIVKVSNGLDLTKAEDIKKR